MLNINIYKHPINNNPNPGILIYHKIRKFPNFITILFL